LLPGLRADETQSRLRVVPVLVAGINALLADGGKKDPGCLALSFIPLSLPNVGAANPAMLAAS